MVEVLIVLLPNSCLERDWKIPLLVADGLLDPMRVDDEAEGRREEMKKAEKASEESRRNAIHQVEQRSFDGS